jgi:hypothetical protein
MLMQFSGSAMEVIEVKRRLIGGTPSNSPEDRTSDVEKMNFVSSVYTEFFRCISQQYTQLIAS